MGSEHDVRTRGPADGGIRLQRRDFLVASLKVACGAACAGALAGLAACGSGASGSGGETTSASAYPGSASPGSASPPPAQAASYSRHVLLQSFKENATFFDQVDAAELGKNAAARVAADARAGFETLMPDVPYVGDPSWPLPSTLIGSAVALSYYRALQKNGVTGDEAVALAAAQGPASLKVVPPAKLKAEGAEQFTQQWYAMQQKFAPLSQLKQYSGDWVYTFVEGVPGEFDWGWDFTECGILKFYTAQKAAELTPSLCVQDFYVSKAQGTGLRRTMTLARGDKVCDFRYQQGRKVVVPA
jgi:hypothetical protein